MVLKANQDMTMAQKASAQAMIVLGREILSTPLKTPTSAKKLFHCARNLLSDWDTFNLREVVPPIAKEGPKRKLPVRSTGSAKSTASSLNSTGDQHNKRSKSCDEMKAAAADEQALQLKDASVATLARAQRDRAREQALQQVSELETEKERVAKETASALSSFQLKIIQLESEVQCSNESASNLRTKLQVRHIKLIVNSFFCFKASEEARETDLTLCARKLEVCDDSALMFNTTPGGFSRGSKTF